MSAEVLTRRTLLKGAAVSAGAGLLAACQPQTVEVTKVVEKVVIATAAPKEQITLRYMDIGGEQGDFQRAYSRTFEDRNPGITISNETLGWGDLTTKVAVAVAAGTMADLAFQHGALMLPGLAQKGAWLDLTPLANADNHDFSIYYDWAVETLMQGPGDELVAMPMGVHTGDSGVVWNVQMLQNAGIPDPSTAESIDDVVLI